VKNKVRHVAVSSSKEVNKGL